MQTLEKRKQALLERLVCCASLSGIDLSQVGIHALFEALEKLVLEPETDKWKALFLFYGIGPQYLTTQEGKSNLALKGTQISMMCGYERNAVGAVDACYGKSFRYRLIGELHHFGDEEILYYEVGMLGFSNRVMRGFIAGFEGEQIAFVFHLVQRTKSELSSIPNLGDTSIQEIEKVLTRHGLCLGMKILDKKELPSHVR